MDVMSLDTNIQLNEGILKLSVTKHMKISTKTTHSYTLLASLNFIRLLRVVITPLRGENDSKQSDEFQANYLPEIRHE